MFRNLPGRIRFVEQFLIARSPQQLYSASFCVQGNCALNNTVVRHFPACKADVLPLIIGSGGTVFHDSRGQHFLLAPRPSSPQDPKYCPLCVAEKGVDDEEERHGAAKGSGSTKFLYTYFWDRRIKLNVDSIEISECVRRAEEARERFKRIQKALEPKQEGAGDSISKFSDAQKYNRRLLNNRKSAAATRVYREVLAHTLCTVADERDRIAEEIKMYSMEIKRVAGEVKELRSIVRKTQAEEAQKRALEQYFGRPQHEQKRLKALYCTFPHKLAPFWMLKKIKAK